MIVNLRGELKNGLIHMDDNTITDGTNLNILVPPLQPVGLIGHMIFFIA